MLRSLVRPAMVTAGLVLLLGVALALGAALAFAQDRRVTFDIPAQPLEQALKLFQTQSGAEVLYAPPVIAGKTSAPVSGSLTVAEGIGRLLAGTGLAAEADARGRLAIVAAPPAAPPRSSEVQLPEMSVKALIEQEQGWGPVEGYRATRSLTGLKTDTPLIETPQSVTVVTRGQMADQQVQTTLEALRYTAGVLSDEGRRGFEFFSIRGFDQSGFMFRDGTRLDPLLWVSSEPYGLERVEVMKGASSILYGEMGPGGLINVVSKRPPGEALYQAEISYGSFDHKRIAVDIGGPIGTSGKWAYRLTGLHSDREDLVDFVDARRTYIAPALTVRPLPGMSLTLLLSHQEDDLVPVQAMPAFGTILRNVNGRIPARRFIGEPGFDNLKVRNTQFGYAFEHRFSESLAVRQNFRYADYDVTFQSISGFLQPDQRTLDREAARQRVGGQVATVDTQLESRFDVLGTRHTLLAGADYLRFRSRRFVTFGFAEPLDLFAPVYRNPVTLTDAFTSKLALDHVGLYLQDQVKLFDRFVLVLGGRHDEAVGADTFNDETTKSEQSANTGRMGLVYLAPYGLAPYASWSTSFVPQSGSTFTGDPFEPTTGTQIEVGLKYEHPGGRFGATLALFQLKQQNTLTDDPANPGFSLQVGEQVHRGIEVEAKGRVFPGLALVAAYSFLEAEVTKSNFGDEGKRPVRTRRHAASLWATYELPGELLRGWKVAGGVRYVGKQPGDFLNTFNVRSSTLFDAALYYAIRGWRFAVTAKNLADRQYVDFCNGIDSCNRGDPRTILGTIQYNWK